MIIECIALEQYCATDHRKLSLSFHSYKFHAVFHSFLSDNRKQDTATKASHIKRIIDILKNRELLFLFWLPYGRIPMSE